MAAVSAVLLIFLAGSVVYSLLSIIAAFQYLSVRLPGRVSPEPISILKPLSGLDVDLESNLRTFFEQDYPILRDFICGPRRRMIQRLESSKSSSGNIPRFLPDW